jgi:hypothetical protein
MSRNSIISKAGVTPVSQNKKYLTPVEERKKLNIDITKIKADIL